MGITKGIQRVKQDKITVQIDGSQKTQIVDQLNNVIVPTQPTDIQLAELIPVLKNLILVLANPSYVDKSANQIRSQVTGSVTATVASTTISTIDGYGGRLLMLGTNNNAWANTCRRLIT